jgi:hypothetical protein
MCGIAGIHRLGADSLPFNTIAARLLDEIEHRGRDATGFAAICDAGRVDAQKAACDATTFNKHRRWIAPDTRSVILHTRFATQGHHAFCENNHPVKTGSTYVVHNGHIANDYEVFRDTAAPRVGRVDSEAISALIATRGWEALPACLSELEGAFAIAAFDQTRPGSLVLAKGDYSPLHYVKTDRLLIWASTKEAIVEAWRSALGTPPGKRRFKQLASGEALIVEDGRIEKKRFKVAQTFVWTTSTRNLISASQGTKAGGTGTPLGTKQRGLLVTPSAAEMEASFTDGLDDPKDSTSFDPSGLDFQKCEDCGHWFESEDLKSVASKMPGFDDLLCPDCYGWMLSDIGKKGAGADLNREVTA